MWNWYRHLLVNVNIICSELTRCLRTTAFISISVLSFMRWYLYHDFKWGSQQWTDNASWLSVALQHLRSQYSVTKLLHKAQINTTMYWIEPTEDKPQSFTHVHWHCSNMLYSNNSHLTIATLIGYFYDIGKHNVTYKNDGAAITKDGDKSICMQQ